MRAFTAIPSVLGAARRWSTTPRYPPEHAFGPALDALTAAPAELWPRP